MLLFLCSYVVWVWLLLLQKTTQFTLLIEKIEKIKEFFPYIFALQGLMNLLQYSLRL